MIKWTVMLTLFLVNNALSANEYYYPEPDKSKGFHWYNDPIKIQQNKKLQLHDQSNFSQLTKDNAERELIKLQKELNQFKALAVLNPTTRNIANYKKLQDQMTDRATIFAMQWKKTLLMHPDLDYSLRYSHYNGMAGTVYQQDKQARLLAIHQLTKQYGLFFFYRGSHEMDKQFASVVKTFSLTHNVPIVALSVDKEMSPYFPLTKKDNGIVKRLNIRHFPALMLVDPKQGLVKPFSYGFLPLTDLEKQFLDIATNFKPNF